MKNAISLLEKYPTHTFPQMYKIDTQCNCNLGKILETT